MPKSPTLIADEFLLMNLDKISGRIQIFPQQVAMILGISLATLKANRMKGYPPKFVKERSCIRYRVCDVRDYLNQKSVFNNTGEAVVEWLKQRGK